MGVYARDTAVSADRSRAEIERDLARYGAASFAYMTNARQAAVQFEASDRRLRFVIRFPDPDAPEIKYFLRDGVPQEHRPRAAGEVARLVEKESRQRWRALSLVIKAKLEAVRSGIVTFENEFMAHIVLPNGKTVGDALGPEIERAYLTGKVQPLLAWDGK